MNASGHPTRCKPEYRELAHNCCRLDTTPLELALGCTAPGNTARGVLLFSRPFIPVRKNYLTRRADAWRLTAKRNVVS